jgi:hypothetical protein
MWNAEGVSIPRCKTVRKPRAGNAGRENSPTPQLAKTNQEMIPKK